jgi:hypothetical protein
VNAREWINAYAERVGAEPPTADDWSTILDLAGEAAHASQRVAAPIACWVAAKAGIGLDEALQIAREIPGDG